MAMANAEFLTNHFHVRLITWSSLCEVILGSWDGAVVSLPRYCEFYYYQCLSCSIFMTIPCIPMQNLSSTHFYGQLITWTSMCELILSSVMQCLGHGWFSLELSTPNAVLNIALCVIWAEPFEFEVGIVDITEVERWSVFSSTVKNSLTGGVSDICLRPPVVCPPSAFPFKADYF